MTSNRMMPIAFSSLLAFILFSLLFLGLTFHFWWQMVLSVLLLSSWAIWQQPQDCFEQLVHPKLSWPKTILFGIGSALILYLVFAIGNSVSQWLFSFAKQQIGSVYHLKSKQDLWLVSLLMVFIIGPGEEFFWRGYVQKYFQQKWKLGGLLFTAIIYALVHSLSGNFMLIMAALVCGLFWGWLYYRYKSLWMNMISHAVWDLTIFVLLPLN